MGHKQRKRQLRREIHALRVKKFHWTLDGFKFIISGLGYGDSLRALSEDRLTDMKGFRMIRTGSGNSFYTRDNGRVEYVPKLKYRIEKKNAYDHAILHQREPYREDVINIEAVLRPEEYSAFLYFLTIPGKFYIEFTMYGTFIKQFPVIITQLPKMPDDLHEYPEIIKLSLESRYTGELTIINFDYIHSLDEWETVYR